MNNRRNRSPLMWILFAALFVLNVLVAIRFLTN